MTESVKKDEKLRESIEPDKLSELQAIKIKLSEESCLLNEAIIRSLFNDVL